MTEQFGYVPGTIRALGLSAAYLERRARVSTMIYDILASCNVAANAVRGSWRYGDFHLDARKDTSLSDLDLVVGASPEELAWLLAELTHRLAAVLRLKVAIHPVESMAGLSIEDSRLLLPGEYIISMARKVPAGLMTPDYVRAKIALLFLRESPTQRYLDVAQRIGNHAAAAAEVKLGVADTFSEEDMASCLATAPDPNTRLFVNACVRSTLTSDFVREWTEAVRRAPSVQPWLKEFIVTRVGESLAL